MKIAIISDIHGNLEALKTTLTDIKNRNVDKIFCLGDTIAKGVHPKQCIKLVQENCDIVLRGNCDRAFASNYENVDELSEPFKTRLIWNQSMLNEDEKEYLVNLPFCYEFYMSGSLVRLFHASPEKDTNLVINNDSLEEKLKLFYPTQNTISQKNADVVMYGHIHHQYMDKLYNKTLINVGSVGNTFDVIRNPEKDSNVIETTRINYVIIEGEFGSQKYNSSGISFQFINLPYDIDKELEDESLNVEKDGYRLELKNGLYRNMDKIYEKFNSLGIKP